MPGRHTAAREAFTLLELLIVIVILGILAAITLPRFQVSAAEAKKNTCAQNVANINAQVERWYFEKGSWPATNLSDIASDADYFPDGIPTCPVDGTAYALDATTHRVTGHSH
ncbi:MAG: competence type IV pilus major pilin ComGC [bacterium]